MSKTLEEQTLYALLAEALCMKESEHMSEDYVPKTSLPKNLDYERLFALSDAHQVTYLLYDVLNQEVVPEKLRGRIRQMCQALTAQGIRNLFLTKYLVNKLAEEHIQVLVLKGAATATYYPVPFLRKSGDVDLVLPDIDKLEAAVKCLEKLGLKVEENQDSNHHVAFMTEDGIEVELHTMLVEEFDNSKANDYVRQQSLLCGEHKKEFTLAGVTFPGLDGAYHAYELLLHMLQHFLRAGFGVKLLCDWVCFWNQGLSPEEQQLYLKLVNETKIRGFSDQVTSVCCNYLGLNREQISFMGKLACDDEAFLEEIMEAEEFGKSSKDRMVGLRGSSVWDYVREFHHQMRLNYPKASKIFLFWPIGWIITLVRFLKNNRKVRGTKTKDILKKAGQRGKIMKDMRLFKR